MKNVERFNKIMNFESVDRLPIIEWAPYWDKTVNRWHGEGLSEKLQEPSEIRDYFGFDSFEQFWVPHREQNCPVPESHGAGILSSTEEYLKLKDCLFPDISRWLDPIKEWAPAHEKGDMVIWITFEGFFWFPRELFGIERNMYTFYDHPELMHMMNDDLVNHMLQCIDVICGIMFPVSRNGTG